MFDRYFTVVFKDLTLEERRELVYHPRFTAGSYEHLLWEVQALRDRQSTTTTSEPASPSLCSEQSLDPVEIPHASLHRWHGPHWGLIDPTPCRAST